MPYKDYEFAKQRAKAKYHEKAHGIIIEPQIKPRDKEEQLSNRLAYFKEYYSRPEVKQRQRNNELKRLYGITWEQKVLMYESQEGICPICNTPLPEEISLAHVDHNHETGQVRGLVHKQCNTIIAYFETDIERISRLLNYLKKKP